MPNKANSMPLVSDKEDCDLNKESAWVSTVQHSRRCLFSTVFYYACPTKQAETQTDRPHGYPTMQTLTLFDRLHGCLTKQNPTVTLIDSPHGCPTLQTVTLIDSPRGCLIKQTVI